MKTKFGLTFYGWYLVCVVVFIILLCTLCGCTTINGLNLSKYEGRTIEVPAGMQLTKATLEKDSSVWLFMQSMDSNYIPKVKVMQKNSKYGIVEDKIIFRESK